jgi:hypothetical protein
MHSRRPVVHNVIALIVATFVASIPTAMRLFRVSAVYPLATECAHEQAKIYMISAAAVCIWLMIVRLMQYLFDALYVSTPPSPILLLSRVSSLAADTIQCYEYWRFEMKCLTIVLTHRLPEEGEYGR